MASIRLQPPTEFNFRTPDEWPYWKKQFKQFHLASGLSTESGKKQVSTLLYCMGEDAEDMLALTHIPADDRKDYAAILKKFNDLSKCGGILFFNGLSSIGMYSLTENWPNSS